MSMTEPIEVDKNWSKFHQSCSQTTQSNQNISATVPKYFSIEPTENICPRWSWKTGDCIYLCLGANCESASSHWIILRVPPVTNFITTILIILITTCRKYHNWSWWSNLVCQGKLCRIFAEFLAVKTRPDLNCCWNLTASCWFHFLTLHIKIISFYSWLEA